MTVRDEWIPMPDGVRLHTRIWSPSSPDGPVPVLLEYLPYRLDDWTAPRDSERHPWYAQHGYASVRVDIRGTGSSDGFFDDEYSEQELRDGEAVIAWLAEQEWSTGAVGMFGISWGGFNALQLAARAPEALKAIVTVCSTDDRYDNDVHYVGGAVLGIDMAAWGATMFAFNSRPPRPEVVGSGWVDQWRDRLDRNRPMTPVWLSHQERDDYWRHGSAAEDYDGIGAAVLAVGGWADPYRDAVLRLVANVDAPVKGIVGPWSHQYPTEGSRPGRRSASCRRPCGGGTAGCGGSTPASKRIQRSVPGSTRASRPRRTTSRAAAGGSAPRRGRRPRPWHAGWG